MQFKYLRGLASTSSAEHASDISLYNKKINMNTNMFNIYDYFQNDNLIEFALLSGNIHFTTPPSPSKIETCQLIRMNIFMTYFSRLLDLKQNPRPIKTSSSLTWKWKKFINVNSKKTFSSFHMRRSFWLFIICKRKWLQFFPKSYFPILMFTLLMWSISSGQS